MYVANDVVNELSAVDPLTGELLWTMTVPNAHELIVTRNGKTAYVSCRAGNALRVVDLERHEIVAHDRRSARCPTRCSSRRTRSC